MRANTVAIPVPDSLFERGHGAVIECHPAPDIGERWWYLVSLNGQDLGTYDGHERGGDTGRELAPDQRGRGEVAVALRCIRQALETWSVDGCPLRNVHFDLDTIPERRPGGTMIFRFETEGPLS